MLVVASGSSSRDSFVDLDVGPWAWIGLIALILLLLGIDLYRHREAHAPTPREALIESAGWVACGLAFAGVVAFSFGADAFGEYLSGYLIEKSLSVDNVFVWSMLFTTMAIPMKNQHRVLFWGIFGALALRAAFIVAGSALIASFWWTLVIFGGFLVYTGVKVIHHRADEAQRESTRGLGLLRRVMPVTDELDGQRFFTRINGRRAATPLFAALVVVEVTDVIFAVDSVPAILAVSHEPFLVFASNAFAILGLRAMYFLLANAKERFHYLSHALGGILVFVGAKMIVAHWYHLDTYVSLAIIVAMLVAAIVFSARYQRRLEARAAAAGGPATAGSERHLERPGDRTTTSHPLGPQDGSARAGQIVVGVDQSRGAAAALQWAVREAELHSTTVRAVLAWSYIDQQPPSADFDPHHTAADADRALEAMIAAALTPQQASGVRRQAVCDLPARALLDAAAGEAMLVVGARGLGGFKGLLVGSVSQHCVHSAVVPTVIVRDVSEQAHAAGVVVGVDDSDHARRALVWAVDEARRRAAPLTVVHGYDPPVASDLLPPLNPERLADAAHRVLDDVLEMVDTSGLAVTVTAGPTGPAGAVIDAAGDAELVVVGSRGLGPVRRVLLGSVATQVLHHSPCTVAIIPTTETTDA